MPPYVITALTHPEPDLLAEVRDLRARAYAVHRPEVAPRMLEPDEIDERPGTVVLVARAEDGRAVGTIRHTARTDGPLPLEAEPDLRLPAGFLTGLWFETARYCVRPDFAPEGVAPVGLMLVKASYLTLAALGAAGTLVASRGAMAARFTDFGFVEPVPGAVIRLSQLGGLEHRVFALRMGVDDDAVTAAGHPFARFVREVDSPEIDLTGLREKFFAETSVPVSHPG
ncbi:hypothetical protein ACIB24_03315 [Spongisporangium articulatum]|uniref:Uncharacterized protein n=1 Tax=Spongisporangium articulatum TaxID=3362603 RepID=A0ABW8AJA2_9ACTN